MRIHVSFRLACCFLLFTWALGAAPGQNLDLTFVNAANLSNVELWSRTEFLVLNRPTAHVVQTGLSNKDFLAALQRERPAAVSRGGGVLQYAASMSLNEAAAFKGFTYEQNLLRRCPTSIVLAPPRHPYADLIMFDRLSGRPVALQAYSGSNPRQAIRKLLVTDADADKFIVPKDVFYRIKQAVNEVRAVWDRVQVGQITETEGHRLIRRRAAKLGLSYDPATRDLYMLDAKGSKRTWGRVGTAELDARWRGFSLIMGLQA